MKKKLLFAGVAFMTLNAMQAQIGVGIGNSVIPDGTAILDVGATDKGVLIPRVTLSGEDDKTTIKGGNYPESLLVYHIAKDADDVLKSGFYFWDGKLWRALMSKSSVNFSETITKLGVKQEGRETVLVYEDEKGTLTNIEISKELQKSTNFETWVKNLVNSTAAGVVVAEGTGITVTKTDPVGNSTVTTYTIAAKLNEIALTGDVSGMADSTSVDKIKGSAVTKPLATEDGYALVYNATNDTWKAGKPAVDGSNITDKVTITVDNSIELTGGTDAVLSATGLKVKALGINDTHLAADAVTTDKIKDANVTTAKIADANVTPGKIAKGADSTVLTTNATGDVVWVALQETAVAAGAGVTVGAPVVVENVKTYTVSANPSDITLGGDVVGKANDTKVQSIQKIPVNAAAPTIEGQALIYDAVAKEWKPGMPKLDGSNVTFTKGLLSGTDAVIKVTNGDAAMLKDVTLSINDKSIKSGMIGDGEVKIANILDANVTTAKIADANVTTAKIADANVTPGKIAKGADSTVLRTNAAGVVAWEALQETAVAAGAGVTVGAPVVVGNVKTYTVSANPSDITLGGDVVGKANDTKVQSIQKIPVNAAAPTIEGQALIYDAVAKEWKPGMPKLDGSNVTFTKGLLSGTDAVIKVTNGDAAMLKDVTLSINDKSIKSGMIGDGEVKIANILDANVTTAKIADANVTPGKIAKGADSTVLRTNAAGVVAWEALQETAVAAGAGVTVGAPVVVGNVKTYTVSANPSDITLGGDVVGKANDTKVQSIQKIPVNAAAPTIEGQALIYDAVAKEWKPGMPKLDGSNVTFTKGLLSGTDAVIKVTNGDAAMLKDVTLSINDKSIKSGMIGDGEVKVANILDANVTTAKIADANITPGKIAKGADSTVLRTNAAGVVAWEALQETAVAAGAGVTVGAPVVVGNVKTYTVSANPSDITLGGDVVGKANDTKVQSIQKIPVNAAAPTIEGQALIYDAVAKEWKPGMPKLDGSNVTFTKGLLSGTDAVIKVTNGDAAMLKDVTLSINDKSIKSGMIGDGEVKIANILDANVTTAKIADANVTTAKIAKEGDSTVLVTNATGGVEWVKQNTIIPTGANLNTDGIIVVGDATTGTQVSAGAVLKETTLTVKSASIGVDKLKVAAKDQHLVTDNLTGAPKWESKFISVKPDAVPVATNDVMDGKRVFTVKVTNGTVANPTGMTLGYNSQINTILVANMGYLLSAQIFDSSNKLLLSNVNDVTYPAGGVQFRFGMSNMYSTLPVASNYIVILRYVSNETVTP